ncbi:MAG: DUF3500 domain-containing protein [Acidimicrobiia bacterium]|nr:DUF3500 domain-containing protein [Acidimicrobiia bacterium]
MTTYVRCAASVIFLAVAVLAVAKTRTGTEALMVDTANRFLDSLDAGTRGTSVFDFESQERLKWHYFPERGFRKEYGHDRRGITFKTMDPKQRHLAYALLSAGFSRSGFIKATTIMSLEEIVRVFEADTTGHRDAENYHFVIFGKPALDSTWGWRVEGHHVSLHFTMKQGKLISSSPTFFGANPHEVPQGPHQGMRALAQEEDLARAFVKSLNPKQRKQAIFDGVAPEDIVTLASVRAKLEGKPQGIPASALDATQFQVLMRLLEEYANNLPPEIASERMNAVRHAPRDQIFFGWAGDIERPAPQPVVLGRPTTGNRAPKGNYYRVQGPTFLVEYDNTQNQSNHSHSVWRELQGDFGLDKLALHYRLQHEAPQLAAITGSLEQER